MTSQKHVGEDRELFGGREPLKSALKSVLSFRQSYLS